MIYSITIMTSTIHTIDTYSILDTHTIHKIDLVHNVLGLFASYLVCQ